ncbi:group II intron maturase-specific domain-containing protein [Paraburkholderia xenovorans]
MAVAANKTAKQANLIRLLNLVLRGWANYHSHVVAKKAFDRVDHEVWSTLWRWAVRRHPKKGARWVKIKYFKTKGFRDWVFAATENKEDGTTREVILLKESDTPMIGISTSKRTPILTIRNGRRTSNPDGVRRC